MKVAVRSNCFFGAVAIRRQLGGKLEWIPGWKPVGYRPGGWTGFFNNPWGHFRVRLNNHLWSYSALDKNLPVEAVELIPFDLKGEGVKGVAATAAAV